MRSKPSSGNDPAGQTGNSRTALPNQRFFFFFFFFCVMNKRCGKNLPLVAEDGPEAITQALVTIRVTASPLDLESVMTKEFSLHWLQSHLCVKYLHNKYNLILNELAGLLIFLCSPFIWAFIPGCCHQVPPAQRRTQTFI